MKATVEELVTSLGIEVAIHPEGDFVCTITNAECKNAEASGKPYMAIRLESAHGLLFSTLVFANTKDYTAADAQR